MDGPTHRLLIVHGRHLGGPVRFILDDTDVIVHTDCKLVKFMVTLRWTLPKLIAYGQRRGWIIEEPLTGEMILLKRTDRPRRRYAGKRVPFLLKRY